MNKSKEFLLGKLKELYDLFDGIKIRYEFDEHMNLHLIEVLSLDTFENDNIFIHEEIKIQDEFENLFGETEEILFISSDSLNQIKSPVMKFGYEDEKIKPYHVDV